MKRGTHGYQLIALLALQACSHFSPAREPAQFENLRMPAAADTCTDATRPFLKRAWERKFVRRVTYMGAGVGAAGAALEGAIWYSTDANWAVSPGYADADQNTLDRLPHIAMMGDSMSKNFYLSSLPSAAWRIKTRNGDDIFMGAFFDHVSRTDSVFIKEYSSVAAMVGDDDSSSFVNSILGIRDMGGQVSGILAESRRPDLVLMWLGHNSLDWAQLKQGNPSRDDEDIFAEIRNGFSKVYEHQLRRLVEGLSEKETPSAVVVYGLGNFTAFFKARAVLEKEKALHPELYPYLEAGAERFPSMKPRYRQGMIKLALELNDELQAIVSRVRGDSSKVRISYSDSMASVDMSDPRALHPIDAWHASDYGKRVLGEALFEGAKPALESLGLHPH